MKIVLLPGLDGTGQLFSNFQQKISERFSVQIINYPADALLDYQQLTTQVSKQLPNEKFILLAESFSGPIAYLLAAAHKKNLSSLIFVASFLIPPRPNLLKFSKLMPLSALLSIPIPEFIIRKFIMGNSIDKQSIKTFKRVLKESSSQTLAYRLLQINNLELKLEAIDYPVIYIQPQQDFLVHKESIIPFKKHCKNLKILPVNGPHLILQAQPARCAKMIINEIYHSS